MAQILDTDFPIDPTTTDGVELAEILNRMRNAIGTNNSGAAAPTTTMPGMLWLDTSGGGEGVVRMRNAANTGWIEFFDAAGGGQVRRSGDTMTGNLSIDKASGDAVINLNTPPGGNKYWRGSVNGNVRWQMSLGDASDNAGLMRANASGEYIDSPLTVGWGDGVVAVPTNAALPESNNSSAVASTSWLRRAMSNIASAAGFVLSSGNTGYLKLPSWLGGVVVQWGRTAGAFDGGGSMTITFPLTFPNACWTTVADPAQSWIGSTIFACYTDWGGPSPSSFTCIGQRGVAGSVVNVTGGGMDIRWIAVGY